MKLIIVLIAFIFIEENKNHHFSTNNPVINSNEVVEKERFIVRVRSEDGSRIVNAWVSLRIDSVISDDLAAQPPLFYEYVPQGNGTYFLSLDQSKASEKRFMLNVHADGYKQYIVRFTRLRQDVTVILEKL